MINSNSGLSSGGRAVFLFILISMASFFPLGGDNKNRKD